MIEAVGRVVGSIAVEHEDLAIHLAAEGFKVLDEKRADAAGALFGIDYEVVDFHIAAAPDLGGDPSAANPDEQIACESPDEVITRVVGEDGVESLAHQRQRGVGIQRAEQARGFRYVGVGERADGDGVHGMWR